MKPGSVLARLGVLAVTLAVIVGGAAALPWLADPTSMPDQPAAFNTDEIVVEQAPAEGQIEPEPTRGEGIVLIDKAHANRFEMTELDPLLTAITQNGYEVRVVRSPGEFEDQLNRSKALVLIDPGLSYDEDDIEAIQRFVRDGGHLLMFGEPTRSRISLTRFGASLQQVQNRFTPLANRFGVSFGESYLYNMETNDGNFRNIFATSGGTDLAAGVDRTALYTAVEVSSRDGRTILTASDGTRTARTDQTGEFPVAVTAAGGNVVAVGDFSLVKRGNYNVVDNEVFLANLVEFLTSSSREPPEEPS